jgi:hypothetical protein
MRDRLVELVKQAETEANKYIERENKAGRIPTAEDVATVYADYLIANGVIAPPCKAGDKIYKLYTNYSPFVSDYTVEEYGIPVKTVVGGYAIIPFSEVGKTVYLDEKEAMQALEAVKGRAEL